MSSLYAIWHPTIYHGHGKRRGFFEGWYFKLVDANEGRRYAIIPGVFLGMEGDTSHAFVQTLDGVTGRTSYNRYPLSEFFAARQTFEIRIGPNYFSAERMSLDIHNPDCDMAGEVRFQGTTPWPVTLTSPGIMGWYALVPFMECYHGIVSLDHRLSGALNVAGQVLDFTEGHGYIEKDWGQAFPRAWVWMQSNHFAQPGTCLTASVANIPWLRRAFRGFIIGLWHEGQLYCLATYTGAKIEALQVTDTHVLWRIVGRGWQGGQAAQFRLEIKAHRAKGGLLHAPARVAMLQRVPETLTAQIDVELVRLERHDEHVIFQGQGRHAGLEVAGVLAELSDGPAP
jgi:tocopherol cyclase